MWNFDPGGMEPTSNDLPLMANIKDIRVAHYLLDLKVNMKDRVFAGSVTLFLELPSSVVDGNPKPLSSNTNDDLESSHFCSPCISSKEIHEVSPRADHSDSKSDPTSDSNFAVLLDCCSIDIHAVEELVMIPGDLEPTGTIAGEVVIVKDDNCGRKCKHHLLKNTCEAVRSEKSNSPDEQKELPNPVCCKEPLCGQICEDNCRTRCENSATGSMHYSVCEAVATEKSSFSSDSQQKDCSINMSSSKTPVNLSEDSRITKCKHAQKSEDHCSTTCKLGTAGSPLSNNLGCGQKEFSLRRQRFLDCHIRAKGNIIHHWVEPWCVQIWKDGVKRAPDFPAVIRIHYRTRPSGKSLTWAVDQDGSPCVFTQGAWINNRSLFPCQEPPGAMATWQAIIQSPEELMVLMSGDKEGEVIKHENGLVTTLHYTDMLQPSSIVAIAVGNWRCDRVQVSQNEPRQDTDEEPHDTFTAPFSRAVSGEEPVFQCIHDSWPCRIGFADQPILPSRIVAPPSLLASAVSEFAAYLPRCLHAAFQLLGAHPFSRLDLLILPRCFASLGLASPSIIFVSQSLLSGDGSFLPRLAHEISHSWFGILIGARDWTEEWLSEGFATFMEDPIHAVAQKWSTEEYQDWSSLRALLRFQALKAEVENTESELQIMRPMAAQTETSPIEDSEGCGVRFVKNGLNPDKWFLQVHYLKGYFLLHNLASHLSMDKMLRFVNLYVHRYHGQLVLSQDIFRMLFEEYSELKEQGITMETIYSNWLDKPGLPADLHLNPDRFTQGNDLVSAVKAEASQWIRGDQMYRRPKGRKKRRKVMAGDTSQIKFSSEQLILFLEYLLDAETMATRTLDELNALYGLREQNAEVRHRWCELVVKHRHGAAYPDVRHFLQEDQAMGVYLYGEMMASEDPVQQALARDCFQAVSMEMDRGCYRTVHEMLFGEPAERPDDST